VTDTRDGSLVPNIGPRGRRRRLLSGIATLAVGIALAVWAVATGAPRAWRLLLVAPFWSGTLGILQSRAKT
jgi:hypothetical protein